MYSLFAYFCIVTYFQVHLFCLFHMSVIALFLFPTFFIPLQVFSSHHLTKNALDKVFFFFFFCFFNVQNALVRVFMIFALCPLTFFMPLFFLFFAPPFYLLHCFLLFIPLLFRPFFFTYPCFFHPPIHLASFQSYFKAGGFFFGESNSGFAKTSSSIAFFWIQRPNLNTKKAKWRCKEDDDDDHLLLIIIYSTVLAYARSETLHWQNTLKCIYDLTSDHIDAYLSVYSLMYYIVLTYVSTIALSAFIIIIFFLPPSRPSLFKCFPLLFRLKQWKIWKE